MNNQKTKTVRKNRHDKNLKRVEKEIAFGKVEIAGLPK
jgi:hypothetical protein